MKFDTKHLIVWGAIVAVALWTWKKYQASKAAATPTPSPTATTATAGALSTSAVNQTAQQIANGFTDLTSIWTAFGL